MSSSSSSESDSDFEPPQRPLKRSLGGEEKPVVGTVGVGGERKEGGGFQSLKPKLDNLKRKGEERYRELKRKGEDLRQRGYLRKRFFFIPLGILLLLAFLRTRDVKSGLENSREFVKNVLPQPAPLRPGEELAAKGAKPKYPVLMIPGVISGGLELWKGESCASHLFRKRIWGGMAMAKELISNLDCWERMMRLDPKTGLDPEGIKVRGAVGLGAADYLFPGFWVIENLGDLGYDSNQIDLIGFDWRLSFQNSEKRDLLMTKIKRAIEILRQTMGEKVVVVSHSMGSNLFYHFMKWVESDEGGQGGDRWVDENVQTFVSIGGSFLGSPKAYAALLSGEMKDTAMLGKGAVLVDQYVPKTDRVKIMRTFHSLMNLLPKGGSALWGNTSYAPDDIGWPLESSNKITDNEETNCVDEFGSLGNFLQINKGKCKKDYSIEESLELLLDIGGEHFQNMYQKQYAQDGVVLDFGKDGKTEPSSWGNPLASPLPFAPNLTVHCWYGISKLTERNYNYRPVSGSGFFFGKKNTPTEEEEDIGPGDDSCTNTDENQQDLNESESPRNCQFPKKKGSSEGNDVFYEIDIDSKGSPQCERASGVGTSDGDGTVPLVSLGYMCVKGWRDSQLPFNPGKAKVVTKEYIDSRGTFKEDGFDFRGKKSGDHVDIMGNHAMISDLLNVVSGFEEVHEAVYSKIHEIAERVHLK